MSRGLNFAMGIIGGAVLAGAIVGPLPAPAQWPDAAVGAVFGVIIGGGAVVGAALADFTYWWTRT